MHPLGYLDRPRHAVALHPARRIDRVPPQVVDELASSDHTGHHGTGIDTDPEPDPVRSGAPAVPLAKHRERHVGDGLPMVGRATRILPATMYASPIVLIFSSPCSSASRSKVENASSSSSTTSSGGNAAESG